MNVRLKKILKVFAIIILSILALLMLIIGAIQMPAVQNFAKGKLENYLQEKVGTKVKIDHVSIKIPTGLVMDKLYLQGQDVDTLLYVRRFDVGLSMFQLLRHEVDLTSIDLAGVRANVVRDKKGGFNFDYFVNAFTTKEEKSSDSKPFILSLNKIKLQDVGVSFIDNQARNDIRVGFRYFDTRVQKFDLDQNNYSIGDIVLDGMKLRLKRDLIEEVAEKVDEKVDSLREKKPLRLALNGIKLTNFNVDYGDNNSKTFAKVIFGELSTTVKKFDFEKNSYDLRNLLLKDADIAADLFLAAKPKASQASNPEKVNDRGNPLNLLLNRARLDNVKLRYSNTAAARAPGLDTNHLDFSKLNLDLWNFKMVKDEYSGTVQSAELTEKSGLNILKFNTDFLYSQKQAYLKDLYLETPNTLLRDEVVLDYNSVEQLSKNPGGVQVSANLRNSRIAFADITRLVPSLRKTSPFSTYPGAVLNIDTNVKGTLDDLLISRLRLTGLDKTVVVASGRIRNASRPEQLWFDLNVRELSAKAKTVYALLPKNTLPKNISLPSEFTIRGTAKGFAKNFNADLNLRSTLGNAQIKALVDMRAKGAERYDVAANLQALQIGKIIQNKELGIVTGKIIAKGQSFDFTRGNADISGDISALDYNGYRYQNMALRGKLRSGAYNILLDSKDPNANLHLAASGLYREKNPTINLKGNIQKLDLQKLGFYAKPMILAGNISANFSNINPDFLNGELHMDRFAISDTREVYPLQQVNLVAVSNNEGNSLTLNSQIADVALEGKYKLTQIADAVMQTVNAYYRIQKTPKKIEPHQHFSFSGKLKNDDLIRKFVPDLKTFETIAFDGNFDADSRALTLNATAPQVTYGANNVSNAALAVHNEGGALLYSLKADRLQSESLALEKINVEGQVENDLISYRVTTRDGKDVTQYLIAGTAKSAGGGTEISLNEDGLTLNYSKWQVAPGNLLRIGGGGIYADNFNLSNSGSSISLQSESKSTGSPLNIDIKDFKIETIAEMIKKDSLPAAGTINGTVQIRNLGKNMTFSSDLKVSDLKVYENPVGNLAVKLFNSTPSLLQTDIRLTGNDNNVAITGTYNTAQSAMNLRLAMQRFQIRSLQGFTQGAITRGEGYISGNLDIGGSLKNPSILGALKFNNAGMEITKLGGNFRKMNDEIRFTQRGINLDDFHINDEDGNAMVIDGDVLTQDYRSFAFNLTAKARDFKVVDSEKDNDKLMYGTLAVNADLNIGGNQDLPKVDGRLSVTDNTDFTFVVPQSSPTLQDREGIVEFIDKDQVALNGTLKSDSIDAQSDLKGFDVNVNIEIHREAKISLLIDKANGDFVKLQGEAELTGGIDPSGKTTLVGTYEVEEGAYEVSVSLLKRKFDIQKGSTITWNGEPTDATLDITAVYRTQAAPIDLVEQQISGVSGAEMNQYKQKIPFNTELKMSGQLLKPVILFDISMDESNPGVATAVVDNTKAKLDQLRQEPSEMNKQVFALLALNRFIGENPFASSTGLSAESLARQSVSKILSQTLNDLAGDLIAGVDINFDLESTDDYSMGEKNTRTDLNVGLSKKLLNDRLKVTVGSSFALEGDARQNEQTTNIAGDISIDYQLSRDGRYMLRAYRQNQYEVALQGQIVETGVSFIITLDYNKFRDILRRQRTNKGLRKANREMRKNAGK